MMADHSASLGPIARKPKKEWAPQGEEKARIEAMLAKCKKHTEPSVAVSVEPERCPPVPPGVPHHAPQLVWNRTSSHEMTSGCQRYKIQKTTIEHLMTEKGKAGCTHAWRYQPWVRIEWLWFIHLGSLRETFEQAKDACEQDLRQREAVVE